MLIEYKFFEPAFYHTDLADWGMANTLFFAKFSLKFFLIALVSVVAMALVAALYPALKAAAMKPVEAIKFR